ncbi:MAG: DUF4190 domain-containing protein [Akkermansiaceae bacterium]
MHPQQPSPVAGPPQIAPTPGSTAGLAVASIICGIASLVTLLLTGIPAIVCGHMALKKIKRSNGAIGGSGMAITGLVLGYVSIALTLVVALLAALAMPVILKQQKKAQLVQSSSHSRQLFYSLIEYDQDKGAFPDKLEQLQNEKYVPDLSIFAPAKGGEWIYFSGQSTSDDSSNILLATPIPIDGKRVILRIDGSTTHIPEADYQAAVRAQQSR